MQVSPSEGGIAGWALIAVRTDGEGDVWATLSPNGVLEMVFAPPPPWSAPVMFSESTALPGLPAVVTDAKGQVHALWCEAETPGEPGTALFYAQADGSAERPTDQVRWARPVRVLQLPEGGAKKPASAAPGNRLHAVWSGGENGESFYSRAFLRDACAAGGPLQPPATAGPSAIGWG